jgi:hypothetical protein
MQSLKREEIPEGKIQIRHLDPYEGDKIELVDAKDVTVKLLATCDMIVDEDLMLVIAPDTLDEKVKSGKLKRVRTIPPIRGGQ